MPDRAVAPVVAAPTRAPQGPRVLQRRCACAEHGQMCERCAADPRHAAGQRSPRGWDGRAAPRLVHDVLAAPGRPLDRTTRGAMETRLGRTFADVRVHTDGRAAASARAVDALAYTVGRDIVFGEGRFAPHTDSGRALLAHELAHVVQQADAAPAGPAALRVGPTGDEHERQAEAVATGPASPMAAAPIAGAVLQRQPAPDPHQVCFDPVNVPARLPQAGECAAWAPAECPSYEQWLRGFRGLRSEAARDTSPTGQETTGFHVVGDRATRPVDTATTGNAPVAFDREQVADRFIDHPTEQWVTTCLPPNLRETAYRLPSDCADIAVILRHVWLSGHHRTETLGRFTIGDQAGGDRRAAVGKVIGEIFTGNVGQMVNGYRNASGQPLRAFADLEPLLHPGDILVWEHHRAGLGTPRSGGHTHTITDVTRANNRITRLDLLQGNQPIFGPNASVPGSIGQSGEIRQHIGRGAPSESVLRDAPGRRIEASTLTGSSLRDLTPPPAARRGAPTPQPVWTWADGHTTLVVAGPARTTSRPAAPRSGTAAALIGAWLPQLRSAAREQLQPTLEGALFETRSLVEQGQTGFDSDAANLGTTAGERLWTLARRSPELADETHFRPLVAIKDAIAAIGNPPTALSTTLPALRRVFQLIREKFDLSARGTTTLEFNRATTRGTTLVRVLVTGFDPFQGTARPPAGTVNPSGAAALALDNTRIDDSGNKTTIAVESVVLPVDFAAFRTGMVEGIVRPLLQSRGVDALITTSLDERIGPADAVRLERFVVGVHQDKQLEAISAAPGGSLGPAIIETPTPVDQVAADTEQPATRRSPGITRPTVGTTTRFRFRDVRTANAALQALGLARANDAEVDITDPAALQQIVQTMRRNPNGTDLDFRAGTSTFQATVIEGPGGNFLSNEVSYRTLRLIAEQGQSADVPSFHVHVPRATAAVGERIPQDTSSRAARSARSQAIAFGTGVRDRIVATLRSMILAVGRRIVTRQRAARPRSGTGGGTP